MNKLTPQQKIAIIDAVINKIKQDVNYNLCEQLRLETEAQTGLKLRNTEIWDEFGFLEFKPADKVGMEEWFPFNRDGQMMRLGILVHIKSKLNTL